MQVDIIKTYAEYEKLKSNWNEVYLLDPEAQYFLSWEWLSQVFSEHPTDWFILAVKNDQPNSKYVAFLPLRIKLKMSKSLQKMYNDIGAAGEFLGDDYAGLICDPGCDEVAIPLLALQIQNMSWRECCLNNLYISDYRLSLFLASFSADKFSSSFLEPGSKDDNINRLLSPYVELPESFEIYLNENLCPDTRQDVRRHLSKIENSETFKIIQATPSTYQDNLDILLYFCRKKWKQDQVNDVDRLDRKYREILQQGLENNSIFLSVLWQGDKPIAALGSFIDRQKQAMLYFAEGQDESFNNLPPGLALQAHSIRWAISNGLKSYSFLRGNEPFRYSRGVTDRRLRSRGVTDRRLRCLFIETKSGANLNFTLDLGSLDQVLAQTMAYQESGCLVDAEIGYRQLLEICPQHINTIGGYAHLLCKREKFTEARRAFLKLLQLDTKSITGWRGLGKSLLGLGKYEYAEIAIRKAIHFSPADKIDNRYYLGLALLGQNQESATTEFTMALSIKASDEGEVEKQKYARGFIEQFAVT